MTSAGMQIHPIRTEQDHEMAVRRIEKLIGAVPGSAEGDELDILATLVDAYEAKHHAIDAPDPVTAIEFRMEQQGLSRKDLEPLIGSRARVSEILTRKRSLTLNMVRRLKLGLGISADLLIGATPMKARHAYGSLTARKAQPGKTKSVKRVSSSRRQASNA
jgi:HTH-type transcriptional regulator / antitoxin HigA